MFRLTLELLIKLFHRFFSSIKRKHCWCLLIQCIHQSSKESNHTLYLLPFSTRQSLVRNWNQVCIILHLLAKLSRDLLVQVEIQALSLYCNMARQVTVLQTTSITLFISLQECSLLRYVLVLYICYALI